MGKFQNDMAERLYWSGDFSDEASDETWQAWYALGFDDENAGWYIIMEDSQGFVDVAVYGFGKDNEGRALERWEYIVSVIDQCAPCYHD